MFLASCDRPRQITTPPAPVSQRNYVDLLPGWRLTLITPIKPGAIELKSQEGLTLTGTAAPGFGYERTLYRVTPRGLTWAETTRTIDGKESPLTTPPASPFPTPTGKQHIRMLFLTRASAQDHNTALLFASTPAQLDALTPACREASSPHCIWLAPGIAARPEVPSGNSFKPAY